MMHIAPDSSRRLRGRDGHARRFRIAGCARGAWATPLDSVTDDTASATWRPRARESARFSPPLLSASRPSWPARTRDLSAYMRERRRGCLGARRCARDCTMISTRRDAQSLTRRQSCAGSPASWWPPAALSRSVASRSPQPSRPVQPDSDFLWRRMTAGSGELLRPDPNAAAVAPRARRDTIPASRTSRWCSTRTARRHRDTADSPGRGMF